MADHIGYRVRKLKSRWWSEGRPCYEIMPALSVGPETVTEPMGDRVHKALAKDVLTMAGLGSMPDSYWLTDRRILRACRVLGITPEKARQQYGN
jgi:hypothetical protein